jgi:hypothetical protein
MNETCKDCIHYEVCAYDGTLVEATEDCYYFKAPERLMDDVLDLINRQKAEIERLRNIVIAFTNEVCIDDNGYYVKELSLESILDNAKKAKANIKAESTKAFVERLQDRCSKQDGCLWSSDIGAELSEFIGDNKVQWSKQGKCPVTPQQFNAIYEDDEGDNE